MAKDDKVKKARREAKFAAMEGLKGNIGLPVPPRKAMSQAKKAGKGLGYPIAPYQGNLWQFYRWASEEWSKLGRWQNLAAPVIVIVALLTWEKERAVQEDYFTQLDKSDIRAAQAVLYGSRGAKKPRKLLGVIPLPGGR